MDRLTSGVLLQKDYTPNVGSTPKYDHPQTYFLNFRQSGQKIKIQ